MRYHLLDTNACIALLNKTSRPLMARVRRHEPAVAEFNASRQSEMTTKTTIFARRAKWSPGFGQPHRLRRSRCSP